MKPVHKKQSEVLLSFPHTISSQRMRTDEVQDIVAAALKAMNHPVEVSVQQVNDTTVEITLYREWNTVVYVRDDGSEVSSEDHLEMWHDRLDAIQERVDQAICKYDSHPRTTLLHYSMYQQGEDGLPIDNLDQVTYEGQYQIHYDGGCGNEYHGRVLTDPTNLAIAVEAEQAILASGDQHHVYLEAAYVTRAYQDGCPGQIDLVFGS